MTSTFAVCIPTWNPGATGRRQADALACSDPAPAEILVVDSGSEPTDLSPYRAVGARIEAVARYDHGGTRNAAVAATTAPVVVFLTHDAVPVAPDSIGTLVDGLDAKPRAALAFGRQVAAADSTGLARRHRAVNYPERSEYRTAADLARLGTRAAFASNAFAAYRRSAFDEIGPFPAPIASSEDRYWAARALEAGLGIAYVAEAVVEHSHDWTAADDLRRFFDIGVFDATHPWFRGYVGSSEAEGVRFARTLVTETRAEAGLVEASRVVSRLAARWAGYRSGRMHRVLPSRACRRLSASPAYWGDR